MLARQNLTAAVCALFLSGGATAAWAASDDPGDVARRGALFQRPAKTLDRAIDRHEAREQRRERRREQRRERRGPDRASVDRDSVASVPRGTLEAIASCESGGDPAAVSADGTYRGKYQFDTGTWASVGGKGDPAAASEAEQDYRAGLLYARSGSSPWPVCG